MSSNRRRAKKVYHGERVRGSFYTGGVYKKKENRMTGKGGATTGEREPVVLKLVHKPNGAWGYRFKSLRRLHRQRGR